MHPDRYRFPLYADNTEFKIKEVFKKLVASNIHKKNSDSNETINNIEVFSKDNDSKLL